MSQYANIIKVGVKHPSVKQVIEIAEEILDENKVLDIDTLYNRAKKRLKLPSKGLKIIIQILINKKILVNRSKFTKRTVLSNTTRKIIFKFIQQNIGAHFSLIKTAWASNGELGSPGELIWHLDMLNKFNFIKRLTLKNYTIFIPFDVDDESGKVYFVLQDKLYRKILTHIVSSNIQERSAIYKNIGENRETTYYRIQNLIEFHILELVDKNKIKINPVKKEIVVNILNKKYNNQALEYSD